MTLTISCLVLQAFSQLSDKLEPLVEGVRDNRQHWIALAEGVETKQNKKSNGIVRNKNQRNTHTKSMTIPTDVTPTPNSDLNNELQTENDDDAIDVDQYTENDADEDETGIEADDDDSETELLQEHSTICYSTASSRLSTPPPTGEEDSSPNSPTKKGSLTETQAQMIAANVDSLNSNILRQRNSSTSSSCRNCECMRVRKTSSLKGANEIIRSNDSNRSYSKSTPSMTNCGTGAGHQQSATAQHQQSHHHQHHHNNSSTSSSNSHHHHGHHHHHHHHHHSHHHSSSASSTGGGGHVGGGLTTTGAGLNLSNQSTLSESDKIPKIVGKLGNLDTNFQHITTTSNGCAAYAAVPNGHFNYLPNNVLSRRHSETNGTATLTTNFFNNTNATTTTPPTTSSSTSTTTKTSQSITTTPQTPICDK